MSKSPDAFRTISEVADRLDTPAHVLRFWESKFPQIKPVKRAGGRRYYRPEDLALLAGIKVLLHEDGLTIKGAQKLLREKGVRHVCSLAPAEDDGTGETLEGHLADPGEAPGAEAAQPEPADTESTERPPADSAEPFPSEPEAPAMPASAAPSDPLPAEADAPASTAAPAALPAFLQRGRGMSAPAPAAAGPETQPAPPPPAETADLVAALDPGGEQDRQPKPHAAPDTAPPHATPLVIHESHDSDSEWQPELPFGTLRPEAATAPVDTHVPRPAAAPEETAAASHALTLPGTANIPHPRTAVSAPPASTETGTASQVPPEVTPDAAPEAAATAPPPGLLSLLASANLLTHDPARLAPALARLEELRDRLARDPRHPGR